jgi:hypothetical protein
VSDESETAVPRQTPHPLWVWASLWAVATLFHIGSYNVWTTHLHRFSLACVAAVVVVRPRIGWLIALAWLQLYEVWYHLPWGSNHWAFTSFVNIALVVAWLRLLVRERKVDPAALWDTFAPVARVLLTVMYFFVVFHKLNSDYWDLETSCGTKFWTTQRLVFPWLPDGDGWWWFSIISTVAFETLIPVLLWIPRLRLVGVLLVVGFHGMIGFNPQSGYYNFSSMIFAGAFVFAHEELIDSGHRLVARMRALGERLGRVPPIIWALCAVVLGAWALTTLTTSYKGPKVFFRVLWGLYMLTWAVVALMARRVPRCPPLSWRATPAWLMVVPVLLVFNGLCPQLGLKTETSFAMYSNLRTENGATNHYLYPASWQVFDFQDRLIDVKRSSVKRLARRKQLWTEFELRSRLSKHPGASITYVRDGERVTLKKARENPALVEPLNYFARKLLRFRMVPKAEREACEH